MQTLKAGLSALRLRPALTITVLCLLAVAAFFFIRNTSTSFSKFHPLPVFKERSMFEYAIERSSYGDPSSIIAAIDNFCYEQQWAMNVGDKKGALIDDIILEKKPKLILEIGGYIGYSAIRFGNKQREVLGEASAKDALYISVEVSPLLAAMSTKLVEQAGLQDTVKVLIGTIDDVSTSRIKALVAPHRRGKLSRQPFDMVYLDQWKELYVPDLLKLERLGFIGQGTTVIADNILFPGAPEYYKFMTTKKADEYDSKLVESTVEYTKLKDAILVSTRK